MRLLIILLWLLLSVTLLAQSYKSAIGFKTMPYTAYFSNWLHEPLFINFKVYTSAEIGIRKLNFTGGDKVG